MKTNSCILIIIAIVYSGINSLIAQDSTHSCKVSLMSLVGKYTGECKNDYADGKGEAIGIHHYTGSFKFGLPNGKGVYYYNDSVYHSGTFQDGLKEGKGETHYIRKGLTDSITKGYWCADSYTGKRYVTYSFSGASSFDQVDINPSEQSGNTLTIEIATTTGSPNGMAPTTFDGGSGYVLTTTDLISTNGDYLMKLSSHASNYRSSVTYKLTKFPAKLLVTFSDGRSFNLELYKAAKWTIKLFVNK
jgi:hypothetical protein